MTPHLAQNLRRPQGSAIDGAPPIDTRGLHETVVGARPSVCE
jgi:hypothetical protein